MGMDQAMKRLVPRLGVFLAMLSCWLHGPALADERASVTDVVRSIAAAAAYTEVAMAPDGHSIAWVQVKPHGLESLATGTDIYWSPLHSTAQPTQVTASELTATRSGEPVDEHELAWAPDGKSLAFLSDARSPGQLQLYVWQPANRSIKQLTQFRGFVAAPQWSPDGKTIAVLHVQDLMRAAGPLSAIPPPTGVVDEKLHVQRIARVEVQTGVVRLSSPADLYVYNYDWSPDGTAFVATGAYGAGDTSWYVAQLYRIDAATSAARALFKPAMQIADPQWSPDGRSIAFIGGLMSDQGIASGDVYVIPAAGGAPRNMTPEYSSSAYMIRWLPNSKELLLADATGGGSGLARLDARTGKLTQLWQGAETIRAPVDLARGISLSADGKSSAVIRESFDESPSLWTGSIGKWERVATQSQSQARIWGRAESVEWRSDGLTIQGWLVPPRNVDPQRKYPMITWIHGGPAWLSAPAWPAPQFRVVPLASQDYFIFLPNPRGSAGFGERFKRANVGDLGGGDLRDILNGVRHVAAEKPIDQARIGISGWSYGGYMAMWALTQTTQFRAGMAGAGIANFLSLYGQTGIDGWMIPYFGVTVHDDPPRYAQRSPINFVKNVRTPTLIVTGEHDSECPPPQSQEYYRALKKFGVDTQLVIYPGEGHHFANPMHSLDLTQRMLHWFESNMPKGEAEG
jgi:dipeptidyl aminopeptidase/acylaminoacyl peptidase